MIIKCTKCGSELGSDLPFCPYCGKENELVSKKLPLYETIKILLGSFFLSPFSLYWFFRYRKDPATRRIAYISLAITIIIFVLDVVTAFFYVRAYNNYISSYASL